MRRPPARLLGVERGQRREAGLRQVVQLEAQAHEDQPSTSALTEAITHKGIAVADARAGRGLAFPARRQRLLVAAALLLQQLRQAPRARCRAARGRCRSRGSGPRSRRTARRRASSSRVAVAGHVLGQLAHQLEDLLAAPGLVVELHQQAVRGPDARAAPGRAGGRFVEQRAEDCSGRRSPARSAGPGRAPLVLELAHAFGERVAQARRVGVARGSCARAARRPAAASRRATSGFRPVGGQRVDGHAGVAAADARGRGRRGGSGARALRPATRRRCVACWPGPPRA